jgi:hypothetical protein
MQLAFTVCTWSHLAQAQAMADSLVQHNPKYRVVIGLVDKINDRSMNSTIKHKIVEIEQIEIPSFETLIGKYNLLEMSCLAKPYFAQYLLDQHPDCQKLLFFDSDILIFDALNTIEESLNNHDIILTPHITAPYQDECSPPTRTFLNSGVYNGGFFAIKRSAEANRFLKWWQDCLFSQGYINYADGMGADQLWLNFVPLFFENVLIATNLGYNVAYWNLHQRKLNFSQNRWKVNGNTPLVFFHFSGYNPANGQQITHHSNRHQWADRPDVQPLFEQYQKALLANGHLEQLQQPNAYFKTPWYMKLGTTRGWIIVICRKILRILNG